MATARKSNQLKAALYARVSTAEQHVEVQLAELRQLAATRGYKVVAEYTDVVSGSTATRPGLDQMLTAAANAGFDVLLVARLDRVGRSLVNVVQVIERLTTMKIGFVSLNDPGMDSTTAAGMLMVQVCAAFAQYEKGLIVERTRAGLALAKAAGKHCGRPRRDVDLRAARLLLDGGASVRSVASMLGLPRATLQRRLDEVAHKSRDDEGSGSS